MSHYEYGCADCSVHSVVQDLCNREIKFIIYFLLYIANYSLLNKDRVISEVEVRESREAGTIHRRFTGALLLG